MSPAEQQTPEPTAPEPPSATPISTKIADQPHHFTLWFSGLALVISVFSPLLTFRQASIANDSAAATIYDRTTAAIFELDKIHIATRSSGRTSMRIVCSRRTTLTPLGCTRLRR